MKDDRATEEQVLKFVHIQLKMGPPVQTPRDLWSCAVYIFPAHAVSMDRDLCSVVPLLPSPVSPADLAVFTCNSRQLLLLDIPTQNLLPNKYLGPHFHIPFGLGRRHVMSSCPGIVNKIFGFVFRSTHKTRQLLFSYYVLTKGH